MFVLKLCEKNSSVNLRFKILVVALRARKLFGPAKPFLIACILKTKKGVGVKLCMKDNFIHVKNMWKKQLCKLKVGDFCYGFPGPETFRDLRETGPRSYYRNFTVFVDTILRLYSKHSLGPFGQIIQRCRKR